MRLVLFDIDKTLLDRMNPDTGKFHDCIQKVYGVRGKSITTHGMTDQQIIIEILEKEGFSRKDILEKIEECKREMIRYYRRNVRLFDYRVIDGTIDLLKALRKEKVPTGLVTGNLETIAYIKLGRADLAKYFKFGGFGSDGIKRADLVRIAIERGQKRHGKFKKVFVIGDSPKDIEAGKAAKCITIGVATGVYSIAVLRKSRPDYVLKNLKDTERVLEIIIS